MLLTSASKCTLSRFPICYKDTCLTVSSEVLQEDDFSVIMRLVLCSAGATQSVIF